MLQVKVAMLAFLAGTTGAFRRSQRQEEADASTASTEVSATCTLEFISSSGPEDDEDEEGCVGGDELVQCIVDGGLYVLREGEFDGFKNGDEVRVAMVPTGEDSCVGSPMYKANSISLLNRPVEASLVEEQSTSDSSSSRRGVKVPYSFLIIRAEYQDQKPSCEYGCSESSLRSHLALAIEHMRNASYGEWPATIQTKVMTVQMPYKISDLVHRRRGDSGYIKYTDHRKEIYAKAGSVADDYTYRAIYAPRSSDGSKMISGNAVANTACSPSRDAPTYGKCHAWFNPGKGGWQLMAHEFGHNFGLRHAASLVDSRTSSGKIREYGDQRTFMGPSGKGDKAPSLGRHYVAAARDAAGWLPSSKIKKLSYNDTGFFKLESLQRTTLASRRRASYQALKINCPSCHMEWAKESSSKPDSYKGGDIYVAYSEDIIAVHYMAYTRTENWARLTTVKTLSGLTGNRLTIRFCKTVANNQAYVGISNTYDGRESQDYCDDADANPID